MGSKIIDYEVDKRLEVDAVFDGKLISSKESHPIRVQQVVLDQNSVKVEK